MELTNFYQVCVFLSVSIMVFSLSVGFLGGLGVFGSLTPDFGVDVDGNESSVVEGFTKNPDSTGLAGMGFENAWLLIFGAGTVLAGAGAIGIAIATQNATFVGVYVFSVYFWASYLNAVGILSFGGFLPFNFIMLFTVPVGFIFVAAIAGMLSGT